jgi:hypothetical protein
MMVAKLIEGCSSIEPIRLYACVVDQHNDLPRHEQSSYPFAHGIVGVYT